ncbi:hypothetical protein [Streptomyces sp. JJ36]|uniref:hypothetical protein n=1 Tax=Streptomyces sp. JJ36 TaxID=2736645 RepID=UPI001F1FF101|nr:hypothetical protein [Streptomyces sp. JJ36]MCF6522405.1 hypothetical protein [Streptomyces sp. JJ36]
MSPRCRSPSGSTPSSGLTAGDLAASLGEVTARPAYRRRAAALAARLRAEDGVAPVLAAVDRLTRG